MTLIQDRPVRSTTRPVFANLENAPATGRQPSSREGIHEMQFEMMNQAFRTYGGFVTCDEVVRRLRWINDQPLSLLARRIVGRAVLNVSWRNQILSPLFQFDLADTSVRPACARVLSELGDIFDDWELALWFATPNSWLYSVAPVALLDVNEREVWQAARADRFIACG